MRKSTKIMVVAAIIVIIVLCRHLKKIIKNAKCTTLYLCDLLKCYCGNGRERSKSHLSTPAFSH